MTATPTRLTARPINTWDALKCAGLLLMVVDHAGYFFFPEQLWMRAVGRGAMPVFLFLTGAAAHYRFDWRILIVAGCIAASNALAGGSPLPVNILVSILLVRGGLHLVEQGKLSLRRPWEWWAVLLLLSPSLLLWQFGTIGWMFALAGYCWRERARFGLNYRGLILAAMLVHGGLESLALPYATLDYGILLATLSLIGGLLAIFRVAPIPSIAGISLISRYMIYIYAGHLIMLQWMAGKAY